MIWARCGHVESILTLSCLTRCAYCEKFDSPFEQDFGVSFLWLGKFMKAVCGNKD